MVSRATAVLEAAVDAGVNWVDTSENYFDTGNEALLGAALRGLRGAIQICSKVAPGAKASGGGSGFRPEEVRRGGGGGPGPPRGAGIHVYPPPLPPATPIPPPGTPGGGAWPGGDGTP